MFATEVDDYRIAGSVMFQLSSLLWYVIEVGDYIMSDLEHAEAEEGLPGDADGMWEPIRRLASEVLARLDLDATPPVLSYKRGVCCRLLQRARGMGSSARTPALHRKGD